MNIMKSPINVSDPEVMSVFLPNNIAPEKPIRIPIHFLRFNFSFKIKTDKTSTNTGVIVIIRLVLDALVKLSPQKNKRMLAELAVKAQRISLLWSFNDSLLLGKNRDTSQNKEPAITNLSIIKLKGDRNSGMMSLATV